MKRNKIAILIIFLLPLLDSAYAADCEPNDLGGFFCINGDGSTSDSSPNDVGGLDTYSSNGNFTSTTSDDASGSAGDNGDESLDAGQDNTTAGFSSSEQEKSIKSILGNN